MAAYMQKAAGIKIEVDDLLDSILQEIGGGSPLEIRKKFATKIGYIISRSVSANPRPPQTTVRANIVRTAVGDYCDVTVKEETLPATDRYPTPKTIKKVFVTAKK